MPNLTKLNYFVPEIHISKIQIAEIQIIEIQMAKIQTVEIQILSELGQRWNSLLSQGKVDNFRTTKFDLRTKAKSCSLEEKYGAQSRYSAYETCKNSSAKIGSYCNQVSRDGVGGRRRPMEDAEQLAKL